MCITTFHLLSLLQIRVFFRFLYMVICFRLQMFNNSVHLYSELNGSWWHLEFDDAIKARKKYLTWYWKWRSRRDHLTCCLISHLFCQDVVPGTLRWVDKVAAGGADHSLRWLYTTLTKSATHKNIIFIKIMKVMMTMYYNIGWQNLREK